MGEVPLYRNGRCAALDVVRTTHQNAVRVLRLCVLSRVIHVQGYLAHKKTHPPRTLPKPMPSVLGGS